jgi:hypothetical protein
VRGKYYGTFQGTLSVAWGLRENHICYDSGVWQQVLCVGYCEYTFVDRIVGKDDEVVKLYDLTSLCTDVIDEKGPNPFTVPVAMLLYR